MVPPWVEICQWLASPEVDITWTSRRPVCSLLKASHRSSGESIAENSLNVLGASGVKVLLTGSNLSKSTPEDPSALATTIHDPSFDHDCGHRPDTLLPVWTASPLP